MILYMKSVFGRSSAQNPTEAHDARSPGLLTAYTLSRAFCVRPSPLAQNSARQLGLVYAKLTVGPQGSTHKIYGRAYSFYKLGISFETPTQCTGS